MDKQNTGRPTEKMTIIYTKVKTGGLVRKLSKWGNEKIEKEENVGTTGKS